MALHSRTVLCPGVKIGVTWARQIFFIRQIPGGLCRRSRIHPTVNFFIAFVGITQDEIVHESANKQTTVMCQVRGLPSFHGIMTRPSRRSPSDRVNPWDGAFSDWEACRAKGTSRLTVPCLAVLLGALSQTKLCVPFTST